MLLSPCCASFDLFSSYEDRGHQFINVAKGGTLYQDLPSERPSDVKHRGEHDINIEAGSTLASILGQTYLHVNSTHHQAVDTLAPYMRATARAPDGVVECVEGYPTRPVMSVQFHPELNAAAGDTVQLKIFKHLVGQALLFAQAKDIHSRILSVDTHCDTPMGFGRGGNLGVRSYSLMRSSWLLSFHREKKTQKAWQRLLKAAIPSLTISTSRLN